MKRHCSILAVLFILVGTSLATADEIDLEVMIEGTCDAHAFARAVLYEGNIVDEQDYYDSNPSMASAHTGALAMNGYFDEYDNWIYSDQNTDVSAGIACTTSSIDAHGSLISGGTGPGTSEGFVDNGFGGTITIGTSEEYPLGTEGLILNVSSIFGAWSLFEINGEDILQPENGQIEVWAGQSLSINCLHQDQLDMGHSTSSASVSFTITPEPTGLFLIGLGGGCLMLRKRRI